MNQFRSEQMKSNVHIFRVEGMTCNHCKANVENGLKGLSQISEVLAEPGKNLVTVEAGSITDTHVKETIEKLGYNFGGRI